MVILEKVFGLVDGAINRKARKETLGLLSGSRGVSVSRQCTLDFLEAEVENLGCKKPKLPSIVHKRAHIGLRVSGLGETQLWKPTGSGSWKLMRPWDSRPNFKRKSGLAISVSTSAFLPFILDNAR